MPYESDDSTETSYKQCRSFFLKYVILTVTDGHIETLSTGLPQNHSPIVLKKRPII